MVSVVLPCLNEEAGIGACLQKILATLAQAQIDGEIIVCDNGSTDGQVRTLLDNFDGDALGMWRTAGRMRSACARSSSSRIARN
jgi:glycosyltransferase involved in cell wall biosynthesis